MLYTEKVIEIKEICEECQVDRDEIEHAIRYLREQNDLSYDAAFSITKSVYTHNLKGKGSDFHRGEFLREISKAIGHSKEKKPSKRDIEIMNAYFTVYGFNFFARDRNGKVYAYGVEPFKKHEKWELDRDNMMYIPPVVRRIQGNLTHLSWDDDKPFMYIPKVELKIGDKIWKKSNSKDIAIEFEISAIYIRKEVTVYSVWNTKNKLANLLMETFEDTEINKKWFLTKKECEETEYTAYHHQGTTTYDPKEHITINGKDSKNEIR